MTSMAMLTAIPRPIPEFVIRDQSKIEKIFETHQSIRKGIHKEQQYHQLHHLLYKHRRKRPNHQKLLKLGRKQPWNIWIMFISLYLISYRDKTDNAKCNPSLICMEKSLRLIFNIQWYNTKNSSSQTNDKTGSFRDFLYCVSYFSWSLFKVSIKHASTVTDVNYKPFNESIRPWEL